MFSEERNWGKSGRILAAPGLTDTHGRRCPRVLAGGTALCVCVCVHVCVCVCLGSHAQSSVLCDFTYAGLPRCVCTPRAQHMHDKRRGDSGPPGPCGAYAWVLGVPRWSRAAPGMGSPLKSTPPSFLVSIGEGLPRLQPRQRGGGEESPKLGPRTVAPPHH